MNLAKYYTGATIPHIYFKDYCKESLLDHSLDEQRQLCGMKLSKYRKVSITRGFSASTLKKAILCTPERAPSSALQR